ncbi:hypothetical protein QBC34DRAFT_411656 [Podospora aff. communis PSN243]|uniref:Structure-specific endonuclease subunit SLX4 n=1 Tax=Podospora aff. communis PSN243 TaxID=3040156 RepID=A0AAV9GD87_9PEZI|nr:hypothetical protein QBC34DRAFT_411656 [Podospora aff. communis PSN243]
MAPGGPLLSSPARMAHLDSAIVIISSSPEFPSINELFAKPPKKPALRSGSNAAAIPENAVTSFTTATTFWRSSRAETETVVEDPIASNIQPISTLSKMATTVLESSPELAPSPPPPPPPKQKRNPPAPKTKKASSSVASKAEEVAATESGVGEVSVAVETKSARKRRVAKTTGDGQTTLPKGKVTKPSAKPKASGKRVETVSRHFSAETVQPNVAQPLVTKPIEAQPLDLEMAPRRRIDWTPPPQDDRPTTADSTAFEEVSASRAEGRQPMNDPSKQSLKRLLDDYGHKTAENEDAAPSVNTDVLGKRKLVQMVATAAASIRSSNANTLEASPTKTKLPKKKPRTITELATAAYRLPEDNAVSEPLQSHKDSLLGYFEPEVTPLADATEAPSAKPKKGTKKPAKPKVSKKKEDPRKQLVLSPTSAMKQVAGQDFVFGTASQLATEEDPDLLRALHEAMKASNQPDDDPFCSSPAVTDLALRRRVGNKLWAAGARDEDGDVRDLEVLDLTGSPEALPTYTLPGLAVAQEKEKEPVQPPGQRIEIDIPSSDFDALLSIEPRPKSHYFLTQTKVREVVQSASHEAFESQPDTTPEADFEPPPSNQEHNLLLSQSNSPMKPIEADGPTLPRYELYTEAQLSREIASYGFKAVKKRTAMIALLEQCWASKNPTAVSTGGTAHATIATSSRQAAQTVEPPPPKSPRRPKGRPKKTAAAAATANADPEAPQPVKRPRGRPKKDASAVSSPKATKAKGKAVASVASVAAPTAPAPMAPPSTPKKRKAPAKQVLEIADSESDTDPFASSPMSSPENTQDVMFSPPQSQMDVSITEDTEMSLVAMSPTTQQMTLFGYITKAVTTAPPTKDPAQPSWHEKILMYDPVILEDLAGWLNAGQLDKVGYDRAVAPEDVKKWCESKSVCCVWRVNLHGKERKRC